MTTESTESKVVCELVDSLLSQPALLEAISKNLDVPRNLPANTNSSDASTCTSSRNDCSGAIPRSNYNTRFQNRAPEVEYEVQHIFSRGTPSVQREPSNSLTQHDHCLPRQDMHSMIQSPMYHFTRNFGRQNSQRVQQTKYSKRNFRGPSTFTKEIILLPGPQEEIVVKQGSKQYLYESGHIITTFEFDKMWTSKEVLENLHRAFSPKIDNIEHAISLEKLQATIQKYSTILSLAGCLRGVKSLSEKYELSQDFIHWYLVGRMIQSLERMKDGLRQLGVLHAMEIHKELFEEAFIWKPNPITVDTVDALFSITFSLPGSNYRTIEEKVIGYWRDYLQDCEELSCEAKLEDVLCFITGADVIPPLGFSPQPSIEFLHKCDGEQQMSKFPEANTCGNVLRLPLLQSYEEFRESMDFAILNSPGFGRA